MENKNMYKEQNHKTFISTVGRLYDLVSLPLDAVVQGLESRVDREAYENTIIEEQQIKEFLEKLIEQEEVIFVITEFGDKKPVFVEWLKEIISRYPDSKCLGGICAHIQVISKAGQIISRAIWRWLKNNYYFSNSIPSFLRNLND